MASDKITADGVEVTSFPEVMQKYQVSSVPKTMVGETREFIGAAPESMLLKVIQDATEAPPAGLIV